MEWILGALIFVGGLIYVMKADAAKKERKNKVFSPPINSSSKDEKCREVLSGIYHESINKLIAEEKDFVQKGDILNSNYALYIASKDSALDKSFAGYIRNNLELIEKMLLFEAVDMLSNEYGIPVYRVKEIIRETTKHVSEMYNSVV